VSGATTITALGDGLAQLKKLMGKHDSLVLTGQAKETFICLVYSNMKAVMIKLATVERIEGRRVKGQYRWELVNHAGDRTAA
jgi:hypothetical protein